MLMSQREQEFVQVANPGLVEPFSLSAPKAHALWHAVTANPSIERTPSSVLCTLPAAAHVKR
jgi:hypothetical protein